jgi:putative sterol carrier protein
MTTAELVAELATRLQSKSADQLSQSQGVYQFHLTGNDGGDWALIVDGGGARVESGAQPSPGVTITMAADDFKALASGSLNPMAAFMSGKLTVQGSMGLAMKLSNLMA